MANKLLNKFVSKSFSDLYLQSDFADVHFEFTIGDRTVKLPAHKSISAVASNVFRAMFFGPMKEGDIVKMDATDPSTFKEFLQFFYLPEVELTVDNIEEVARLADKYDMLNCVNTCAEFIESGLTDETMIWGYQLAISLDNQKLKRFCETEIEMLTYDTFKSEMFMRCDKVVVENILKLDSLHCREIHLFKACVEWAKLCCGRDGLDGSISENVRKQLGECLTLIRFASMSNEEIGLIMLNHAELFSRDELRDLLCMKTVKNFKSNVFKETKRTIKWNSSKVLTCDLLQEAHSSLFYIESRESTWFSTNVPVLLNEISCTKIYYNDFHFVISVVEYNDFTFVMNQETTVLSTEAWDNNTTGPSIVLTQPIVIHPNKLYEIRMEALGVIKSPYHYLKWKSEVNLDSEVIIKVHQHPSDSNKQRGFASILYFNRI